MMYTVEVPVEKPMVKVSANVEIDLEVSHPDHAVAILVHLRKLAKTLYPANIVGFDGGVRAAAYDEHADG